MDYMQLSLDDYIQCKTEIKNELTGMVKSFVKVGWQLTRIDKSRAYTLDGYKSIAEFAKAEYGMSPSGASRFMNVYEKYAIPGDTPELQEQYRDFKFAQLVEMIQIPEEDRGIFRPEAKREDIRELQRFNKENESSPDNLLNWKEEKDPDDKLKAAIVGFFRDKDGLLNELYGSKAYQTGNIKEMAEIINPSGSRSYRKGTIFLMMYGESQGVIVKESGKDSFTITWERFLAMVQEIFAEAAAGSRTYENYFGKSRGTAPQEEKPESQRISHPETETVPAQPEPEIEEKGQGTAPQEPEKAEGESEIPKGAPEESKDPAAAGQKTGTQEEAPEEQVPGQDNIENHKEWMPKPTERKPKPYYKETGEAYEPDHARIVRKYYQLPEEKEVNFNFCGIKICAVRHTAKTVFYDAEGDTIFSVENALIDKGRAEIPEEAPAQDEETEIAPAQKSGGHEAADAPQTRKEYMDGLTTYGTAEYLAEAIKGFRNRTYSSLQNPETWKNWLTGKVDHAGRPWIE